MQQNEIIRDGGVQIVVASRYALECGDGLMRFRCLQLCGLCLRCGFWREGCFVRAAGKKGRSRDDSERLSEWMQYSSVHVRSPRTRRARRR
jgi:hypothetical protein